MKKLLVVGCPAGPQHVWSVERKAFYIYNTSAVTALVAQMPEETLQSLDVVFIDIARGLVGAKDPVYKVYRATKKNYEATAQKTQQALNTLLAFNNYDAILVDATKVASHALEGWNPAIPVTQATGGKEVRQKIFMNWLNNGLHNHDQRRTTPELSGENTL